MHIPATMADGFCWVKPERRQTTAVGNTGGTNVPIVISSRLDGNMVSANADMTPDYIYVGDKLPAERNAGQSYVVDFGSYSGEENVFPIFPYNAIPFIGMVQSPLKFLVLQYGVPVEEYSACLKLHPEVVVVCMTNHQNRLGEQRALVHEMMVHGIQNPVVFAQMYQYSQEQKEHFQLDSAADMGALMFDGLTDGIWLMNNGDLSHDDVDATAFGILQASRLRTSKTEYISCPGCGRTLYDLRSTIARIKAATAHLKGLKIGIMGCIVNGPGEMADADYGYVGAGRGKISLYRQKECVAKNIPEAEAVDRLLELIENDSNKRCGTNIN
jgi:(E)-4-hydroxy-3-methylbut-2-enyl-diphosphate synthase